jgi:8-oxo-dGTP diphosphatase
MQADGDVLMAQRPSGKPYEGYREFPGGMEAGEDVLAALKREFQRAACVFSRQSPVGVEHVTHAHVRLDFYICRRWEGERKVWKVRHLLGRARLP